MATVLTDAVDGTVAPGAAEAAAPSASATGRLRVRRAGVRPPWSLTAGGLLIAAIFVAPTAYLVVGNVELGSSLWRELTAADTRAALGRTLLLAGLVSLTSTAIGVALAWLLVRTDVPGRRLWRVLAPLPLVVPSFVGAAALRAGLAPGGLVATLLQPLGVERTPSIDGLVGAWLVLTLFTFPYVYLPVAARFGALPPQLEESARLLGSSSWATFRTVVLPQSWPAIWAGGLLVFLYTVSDFGAVSIMRYGTLTREIFQSTLVPTTWLPLSLLLAVVALVVVALERRVGRRRTTTTAVRDRRPLAVPLRRMRWPAAGFVVVVLGNALVGPLSILGYWAVRGLSNTGGAGAVEGDELVRAGISTVTVSLAAAVAAVALILPVAFLTGRFRSWGGSVANAVVVAGFALPGIVVALSLVFWVLDVPLLHRLYQTVPVLVAAYVVHFGAQAMRAAQVAVGAVPRRYDDAARMLGARRLRRLATVELPLMGPGLLAGGGLVLLSAMKELPATLLLAPTDFSTLATRIWNANESYELGQVGVASLVLVALSGALTWLLVIRRAERFD